MVAPRLRSKFTISAGNCGGRASSITGQTGPSPGATMASIRVEQSGIYAKTSYPRETVISEMCTFLFPEVVPAIPTLLTPAICNDGCGSDRISVGVGLEVPTAWPPSVGRGVLQHLIQTST